MSTQEFVLHPSGRMQIAIQGSVIAQASSPAGNPDLVGRSHSISIYETTHGEIIASIDFHSEIEQELNFCHVERKLSVPGLSELLACQDPTEHIDRAQLPGNGSSDSASLFEAIQQDYDSLGVKIESQLRDFVPREPIQPSLDVHAESKSVSSGWDPFGFGDQ